LFEVGCGWNRQIRTQFPKARFRLAHSQRMTTGNQRKGKHELAQGHYSHRDSWSRGTASWRAGYPKYAYILQTEFTTKRSISLPPSMRANKVIE
jgi:hypothetical protein